MSQATPQTAVPELYQFRYAMFPEKARWALDHCGIRYKSRPVLPGAHPPTMMKLAGQTCTPVLRLDKALLKSSSEIVEWAAKQTKNCALYGKTAAEAEQIKQIVAEFDQIGEHSRRAYFYQLLQCGSYAADLFSVGYSAKQQALYRAGFPMTKVIMKLSMQITKKQSAASKVITQQALDSLAQRTAATGYFVGDQFTAADLTAATVLGVCVLPDQYPVTVAKPYPAPLQSWVNQWAEHPGAKWVTHIYQQHRPANSSL